MEGEDTFKKIGQRLQELREDKNYATCLKFAEENEISAATLLRMEKGKHNFRLNSLLVVLKKHDISLIDFIKSLD